jgi:autotransporter strand-loop-strand O-heptosyltransferase
VIAGALLERDPPGVPTQKGPLGLCFDYNQGARVLLPKAGHAWRVRLTDLDTFCVLYETRIDAGLVRTMRQHYLNCRIEVWAGEEPEPVLAHDYDAAGRHVLIQFPTRTLGDNIAWFSAAARFAERHKCRLTVTLQRHLIPLFRDSYPEIAFATADEVEPADFYATYKILVYYNDHKHLFQPYDYQAVGLHHVACHLLGLPADEVRPLLALPDTSRPIAEPYVCIATQATAQPKYWNNPRGWPAAIRFLREAGYRVICIDQKREHGDGRVFNRMPAGAEDQTGDIPLQERARWLMHASAFVGLSSGLSWLAWATGVPVVLISGFTLPLTEFATPYRVINPHVCNGCWNDVRLVFDNRNFQWCPRHSGTQRQFECTRMILPEQVIATLRRVPGLIAGADRPASALRGSQK